MMSYSSAVELKASNLSNDDSNILPSPMKD